MNLLKNKLILNSALIVICCLTLSNIALAQVTPINWGVDVKSQETAASQVNLKASDGRFFGALKGAKIGNDNTLNLSQWLNGSLKNILTVKGYHIGINQPSPKGDLHIGSNFNIEAGGWTWIAQNWYWNNRGERITDGKVAAIVYDDQSNIRFYTAEEGSKDAPITNGSHKMIINNDGRVAIGNNPDHLFKNKITNNDVNAYKLFVENGILTEKVKVAVAGQDDWADYVFEEDYEMLPINELEDFVTENKHLPNVPSAEEVVENGLDVAKMDAKLLEKIEEAYLYIIDINKAMEAMNEKVDALSAENESLKTSLQSLNTSSK